MELHWLNCPVTSRQPGKEQETRAMVEHFGHVECDVASDWLVCEVVCDWSAGNNRFSCNLTSVLPRWPPARTSAMLPRRSRDHTACFHQRFRVTEYEKRFTF